MWNLLVYIFVILGIISFIFLVIFFPITLVLLVIWCIFYLTYVVTSMLIGGTLFFWIFVIPSILIGGTLTILWYIWNFIQENLQLQVSMLLHILFSKQMIHIYLSEYN